jgi:hypothetical protein
VARVRITAFILAAAVVVACSDGDEPEVGAPSSTLATVTPAHSRSTTPTSTPAAAYVTPSADFADFRTFAAQIEDAVVSRDAEFFFQDPVISSEDCGPPVCPQPTTSTGILYGGWDSEAPVYPIDSVRGSLSAYLRNGAELFAIAETSSDRGAVMDGPAMFAIIRAPSLLAGTVAVLQFVGDEGRWRLRMSLEAGTPEGADNDWLSGTCSRCYDYWERWTD